MNHRIFIPLALLLMCVIPAVLFAGGYTVDYVFGIVEVQAGQGWRPAEIGTVVSEENLLRVGRSSVAELSAGSWRITLSEPGTYFISELMKNSRQVSSWGIVQMVRSKIHNLFQGRPETESTAMGIRADEIADDPGFEWMDEEEDAVEEGKSLLAAERYEEAVGYFEEALELADVQSRSLYLFYIGYAYAMAGKSGMAMRYLNDTDPSQLMTHYGDYVLLHGQLLLEGQSYRAALDLFGPFLARFPDHENTQSVYFLSAFCSNRLGLRAEAAAKLQKAYDLDPSSDTGRKAKATLDSL
jgi:tetratricopeptide (TPR) repeat protein